MRPSKPALPEWARPQDLAPTVENARRLGLPQAARPEAQHGSPPPSTTQQPAEPSWGQRLNRNMRQWGEGVIDRLDEAAVADGGGLVTALAALARTPARSFTSFMQGTAGTVSLLDGRVRGEISDGLSQVMSDPGLIGRAASDYWRSRTLADMAADLYANGAAGAMMGGAGATALGRLNRLPGLGRDVGEIGQAAMRNISGGSSSSGSWAAQRSTVVHRPGNASISRRTTNAIGRSANESLEQTGISRLELPRSPELGAISTTDELLRTGAIPGAEGVILNQPRVLFNDLWRLSERAGVEFVLTHENGHYVLRSGSPTSTRIPRGVRPIVHTHPLDSNGVNSRLPSRADINLLNRYWMLHPDEPRPVSQIIIGPNETTIFRATGQEEWRAR